MTGRQCIITYTEMMFIGRKRSNLKSAPAFESKTSGNHSHPFTKTYCNIINISKASGW